MNETPFDEFSSKYLESDQMLIYPELYASFPNMFASIDGTVYVTQDYSYDPPKLELKDTITFFHDIKDPGVIFIKTLWVVRIESKSKKKYFPKSIFENFTFVTEKHYEQNMHKYNFIEYYYLVRCKDKPYKKLILDEYQYSITGYEYVYICRLAKVQLMWEEDDEYEHTCNFDKFLSEI